APEAVAPPDTTAVDDLTTLLAFAQKGPLLANEITSYEGYLFEPGAERNSLLLTLAQELELLRKSGDDLRPTRSAVGWLKESRDRQLVSLAEAWSASAWNEL